MKDFASQIHTCTFGMPLVASSLSCRKLNPHPHQLQDLSKHSVDRLESLYHLGYVASCRGLLCRRELRLGFRLTHQSS